MKRTIFTNLAPNTETDDVRMALNLLMKPGIWKKGQAVTELEDLFRKYLSVKYAVTFESGRTGLYALLKTLSLTEGDEVLVQAYTCVAVPNSVIWAGGKPVYVDCNPDTFNMDPDDVLKKVNAKTKAIIIQHTFGGMADMTRLMEIARAHELFVIEDCAHAIGSEYKGKKAGTFGHAALFSFGRDKSASSVFGGMVVTQFDMLAEALSKEIEQYPYSNNLWILNQLLHPIITHLIKASFDFFYLGKVLLWFSKKTGLISKAVEPQEKTGKRASFLCHRMPNALAVLALHQMRKIDIFNAHRAYLAKIYADELKDTGVALPKVFDDSKHIFIRYTIKINKTDEIRRKMIKSKIFLGDWYDTPIAPKNVDYKAIGYESGSCQTAENLAKTTINLPTDIHIKTEDAKRIAQLLKINL